MTRRELVELVEQVFATYNQNLPTEESKQKAVYTAWYELLHDLEYSDTRRTFVQMAVHRQFMPRPGELRKATINACKKIQSFEDPLSAWGIWLGVIKDFHSGVRTEIQVSEPLRRTVKSLGEAAYGLHTNSDREAFMKAYEKIVAEIEAELYAVPEVER